MSQLQEAISRLKISREMPRTVAIIGADTAQAADWTRETAGIAQLVTHFVPDEAAAELLAATLPERLIVLYAEHPRPPLSQLALGFLDAVAQGDMARALKLADSGPGALQMVDDCIAVLAERMRTGQTPRETVAAMRALWETRYRLTISTVPETTALPALVAELTTVMAELFA